MTPSGDRLLAAVDVTWPAAEFVSKGPWTLRKGAGGGQRVSAASAQGQVSQADIDTAIDAMKTMGQAPLFMIRPQDKALDDLLEARGFAIKDPVTALFAPVSKMMGTLPSVAAMPVWPPLSVQREIWAQAGIGPARLDVMRRAKTAKTTHLGRTGDIPAGTAFTAMDGDLAMLHALEVHPDAKRKGVGKNIMTAAANWAASQGAHWISVLVVKANAPANAFYASLGMVNSGFGYHYRRAAKGTS